MSHDFDGIRRTDWDGGAGTTTHAPNYFWHLIRASIVCLFLCVVLFPTFVGPAILVWISTSFVGGTTTFVRRAKQTPIDQLSFMLGLGAWILTFLLVYTFFNPR